MRNFFEMINGIKWYILFTGTGETLKACNPAVVAQTAELHNSYTGLAKVPYSNKYMIIPMVVMGSTPIPAGFMEGWPNGKGAYIG